MVTVKADDKRRVVLPGIKPGQVFAYEVTGNVVKLIPVKPAPSEAPLVKMVQTPDGFWQFPDNVSITDEDIKRAIQADREAQ